MADTPHTQTASASVEHFEYKAEMKQLLHLIVHSLYTHPEVFVRELISNASDALNKVRYRQLTDTTIVDYDKPLEIRLSTNPDTHTFVIEDSGIGMTRDDLIQKLGTVASSGTLEFLKNLQEGNAKIDGNLIGQFGVGFYAVFMVADEVIVETRHADPTSQGLCWKSDGQGSFSIEEIDKPTRGTTIRFTLKEQSYEFAQEHRLKSIIQKYSNFVDFPIFIGEEKANAVRALWQLPKDQVSKEEADEFYKFISNDFHAPLGHLHLSIEGSVDFKALVFVPETAPIRPFTMEHDKSLHLYANKVLIQEHCKELLPDYLRFVRGVVDTSDLPLNVSREVTQSSPVMAKINKVLTGKILGLLQEWAENEPSKYETLYKNYGSILKIGVNSDYTNRDAIVKLLRFETSLKQQGEISSLQEYVSRMKSDQTEIYYLAGEHRETMLNNPNLEYFKKHGLEVLLLTDPVDVIVVPSIPSFEGKQLKSIDKADLNVPKEEASSGEQSSLSQSLLATFKEVLGDAVEDVVESKRLVDSAVTLVVGKAGMDLQMERMMKMLDKQFTGSKKLLEVNVDHPLIKNLARLHLATPDSPIVRQYILHLYEGAQLIEGNLPSPALFVRRMTEIMTDATK